MAWARGLTIKINLSEIVFTGIRFLLTTNDIYRHMASSASGQDERNRQLCRGYPSGQDGAILPAGDYPLYPASKIPQKPYNIFFIDQVCSVKMAGYWPRSFFASLWTSTLSRSINSQKKNLANIQPSRPHTWSMTHTSSVMF